MAQKFDLVASETIRSHFPSLIQPYMVRKYSFRGFRNSFGHFQYGRFRGSYSAFPGPWLKNADFQLLNVYSLAFLSLQLGPTMLTSRFPKLILGISWALDQK